ncbi:LysR family transcriptional regulator [Halobacillus hunanensis]|uniref:LysR family transcriptional regulator n=1 Tax=Halobacillus hunanensis TaxID=578214 RepID=UPI0009A5E4DB|nr:LysR family transcriptional regulator [Halobacillus hunanensis]
MELKQIKYFMEVAEREHVTEAALHLDIAQSAVSRQIFNLESELEVDLFIREGRSVRLTQVGRIFYEHMKNATMVIENARREVMEYLEPAKGTVHIGFPSSMAAFTMPMAISAFRRSYPDVKFNLSQGSYHQLIDKVVKGEVNMALLAPVPSKNEKIQGDILFSENIVALLPADHPLAGESAIDISDLKEDAFVMFPEGFILRDITFEACIKHGFKPNVSFEGEDIDAIKGLVSAGLGITLIPEITLVDSLPRDTVKLELHEPKMTRTVGVISSSERQLLPTEQRFYQFLKQFFTRLEGFRN